jgi:protein ImuB
MRPNNYPPRELCLWLPDWPLQRLRWEQPELRRQKLVLYEHVRGGRRIVVADDCPPDLPIAEVTHGRLLAHDPLADTTALGRIAELCAEFAPSVGVDPPDTIRLGITGLGALFGSEERLLAQLYAALRRRRLSARLAIAESWGAAWALAHYARDSTIVPPGESGLDSLPIESLRLGPECEPLRELGILRVSQLLALPRESLAERFGPQLLWRINQALGLVPEPNQAHRPTCDISFAIEGEHAVTQRSALEPIFAELLTQVERALIQRQQGALELACELRGEPTSVFFTVSVFRPLTSATHLAELVRLQLERQAGPAAVSGVRVAVERMAPLPTWQPLLFDDERPAEAVHVRQLINRLSNRLGRLAVVRALPVAGAQPELVYRYEPLTGAPVRKSTSRWKTLPRPTRLAIDPIPLRIPRGLAAGPPRQVQWQGLHTIAHAWGPERIQTGWWRGRDIQRDYFRVATTAGERWWIFKRLTDGQWFLHGWFD